MNDTTAKQQRTVAIPIRVKRDGKWANVDVFDLTADELHNYLEEQDRPTLIRWVETLVRLA